MSALTQGPVHAADAVPSHRGYPVRVPIEGHGYGSVPEEVLDQFRVYAAPQKWRGARVPEVMTADGEDPLP
jgi:hypothetical protein